MGRKSLPDIKILLEANFSYCRVGAHWAAEIAVCGLRPASRTLRATLMWTDGRGRRIGARRFQALIFLSTLAPVDFGASMDVLVLILAHVGPSLLRSGLGRPICSALATRASWRLTVRDRATIEAVRRNG